MRLDFLIALANREPVEGLLDTALDILRMVIPITSELASRHELAKVTARVRALSGQDPALLEGVAREALAEGFRRGLTGPEMVELAGQKGARFFEEMADLKGREPTTPGLSGKA